MVTSLPTGHRGQLLALGIAVIAAVICWLGIVSPGLGWLQDTAEALRRQQAISRRMEAIVTTLPALREQARALGTEGRQTGGLLPGASDALAAAAMQQTLDELAKAAGVRIASQEILPATAAGDFRIIGIRVTTSASWKAFVALLLGMAQADTPMAVDDLTLRGLQGISQDSALTVDASFTVTSLHAVAAVRNQPQSQPQQTLEAQPAAADSQ